MNEINLPYLGPKLTDAVKRRPFGPKTNSSLRGLSQSNLRS